ncbi:NAD+ synthase [Xanthobacter aminoxidans]|uniref:NAD+ synthase n=1 Tax=Xanthobacter aminoxidans TaxID=186280 RepID=UPI00202310CA|nr:NAD+ synthase [Xanthobacter aminoxidans]MCL8384745.1 NAD+ synthase [Xanthobacter aminoxidans]
MTEPADTLLIAIAQLNPTVGDVSGNLAIARRARQTAGEAGADLVVFPELFIAGYPAEDLVLKPAFLAACQEAVEALAAETATGPAVLIGAPWVEEGRLFNSVLLLEEGEISAVRHKVDLPNYGVFDEKRVFAAGPLPGPIPFKGVRLGVPICEDIWGPDVVECLAETGAEILIVPNGSPYRRSVYAERENIAVARVVESRLPLLYVNQVGGQDELVFDGASFVLNADRFPALQFPGFVERVRLSRWQRFEDTWRCLGGNLVEAMEGDEADYAACVVGLRDYVNKNGFPGVVLGLSGGIDSALCAAMAVDALGPERVRCLMLPYRFTSEDSLKDAAAVAGALGVRYEVVPIAPAVEGLEAVLAPLFAGTERDVTEENLQARVRGTLLMSVSNKFGAMVLTTGNKSEMSTGYATLYGDMNGGFNPIKDLYKTEVLRLARLRNRWKPAEAQGPDGIVIPDHLIDKPPSAELREGQTDADALPPYPMLDTILARLVEGESSVDEIVADGFDAAIVARVLRLLTGAEYKRRQAAPGVKVTGRNFGRDRRYPITNRFREE